MDTADRVRAIARPEPEEANTDAGFRRSEPDKLGHGGHAKSSNGSGDAGAGLSKVWMGLDHPSLPKKTNVKAA